MSGSTRRCWPGLDLDRAARAQRAGSVDRGARPSWLSLTGAHVPGVLMRWVVPGLWRVAGWPVAARRPDAGADPRVRLSSPTRPSTRNGTRQDPDLLRAPDRLHRRGRRPPRSHGLAGDSRSCPAGRARTPRLPGSRGGRRRAGRRRYAAPRRSAAVQFAGGWSRGRRGCHFTTSTTSCPSANTFPTAIPEEIWPCGI